MELSVGVGDKLEKIKKYLAKYDNVKEQVWKRINGMEDEGVEEERIRDIGIP